MPGLVRHYYDNRFWPAKIESCHDERVLSWLEEHLCMVAIEPRCPGCSVVEGRDITETKVRTLAAAADACWKAILECDLEGFAAAYRASFEAQVAMFPGMVNPVSTTGEQAKVSVSEHIAHYSALPGVLAWKMPGAGGGGYLALVCKDSDHFPEGAIRLKIRRKRD